MKDAWFASLLTPVGMSAIAVIGVRGDAAAPKLASSLTFRSGKHLDRLQIGEIALGDFLRAQNSPAEEVVVIRTAHDRFEIQCHGGRSAAESILRVIDQLGGSVHSLREWTHHDETCPVRREALLTLSKATAPEPTRILLEQYRGALRREIEQAMDELRQGDFSSSHSRLVELAGRFKIGSRLTQGFQIALLGRPNVGKSSLLNALLGFGRAIVVDEPGTTRDVLTAQAALGGWTVVLHDLAGFRESSDPIEAEGVRRAIQTAGQADLVLLVADLTEPWSDLDSDLLCEFRDALIVHNKCDLTMDGSKRARGLNVSARTGEGLEELQTAIVSRLVSSPLAPNAGVPFTSAQFDAIRRAANFARAGDVERALKTLGELLSAAPSRLAAPVESGDPST
jgi:tRNA modification GTPase